MTTTSTGPRWGAMVIAALCTVVTVWTLNEDIIRGGQITTTHLMQGLAIIIGVFCWPMIASEWRERRYINGVIMAAVTIGAIGFVVATANKNNAAGQIVRQRDIDKRNSERASAGRELAEAEAELKKSRQAKDAECVRIGAQCALKTKQFEKDENHRNVKQAAVNRLGDREGYHDGWLHFARVIALLPGVSAKPEKIAAGLAESMPTLLVLISELGLIANAHRAFAGLHKRPVPANDNRGQVPVSAALHETAKPARGLEVQVPVPPAPTRPRKRTPAKVQLAKADTVVIDWVREFRRHNGRNPQIPELQAAFPQVARTTAWRRCKAA